MTAIPLTGVLHHVRTLAVDDLNDQQLLERYAGVADHAAFAALVRRHGPLVLGVCRRLLGPGPDLDDVFQATFVVLARKAAAIRKQTAVAGWLYGVAYRLALKLRIRRGRRQRRENTLPHSVETQAMQSDPAAQASLSELGAILDEELQRLPAASRDALLLCHLEGLSNSEAAQRLGWPLGTLKGRVQRGRELLRQRLARRGVALSASALAVVLAEQVQAAVPAALAQAAVRCASPAAVAARIATLADGALTGLAASKLKLAVIAAAVVALLGLAAGQRWFQAAGASTASDVKDVETAQDKPALQDALGDPLPPGATARLGTLRWRHGSPPNFIALLPDGKTVVSASNDRLVRVWDAATGKERRHFGTGMRQDEAMEPGAIGRVPVLPQLTQLAVAVSRDGRLVAAHLDGAAIDLWEIATGKQVASIPLGKDGFQPGMLAFSPDGKQLAIARTNGPVRLWDLEAGKQVRELGRTPKEMVPVLASRQGCTAYTPDGKTLVSVLAEVENMVFWNHVFFWDPDTGKELGRFDFESRFGVTSPVFSPDGKLFAFGTPDGEIYLLQTATAQALHKWKLSQKADWPSLVFSADSSKLYTKSAGESGVREWDVKTAKELRLLSGGPSTTVTVPGVVHRFGGPVGFLTLSADGKTLALNAGNSIQFLDAASGKAQPGPGGHSHALTSLSFAADGKALLTGGSDRTVRKWDAVTGKQLEEFAPSGGEFNFTSSPDGRYLACEGDNGKITLVDNQTGKGIATIAGKENFFATLFFAPDSTTLLVKWLQDKELILYDVPSGKERCRIAVSGAGLDAPLAFFFTHDGRRLAVQASPRALTLHELVTGKVVQSIQFEENMRVGGGAFSPDGRTIAFDQGGGLVQVIELASGQTRRSLGKQPAPQPGDARMSRVAGYLGAATRAGTIAFSPDGRLLAHAGPDNVLIVWDMATGQTLARFAGHQGAISAVAFAPGGRSLASASNDTTGLVWDIEGLSAKAGPMPQALDAGAVKARWADLQADKASVAFDAMNTLVAAPKQALPFLRQQLQPAAAVDGQRVAKLIEQLDNSEFKIRQQAQAELLKIGEQTVPYVEKVLAGNLTLETRQRLEGLRDKLTATTWTGERLRIVRAVEVLERIGNAEARSTLQVLADGAPGALLSSQAAAALSRLK
jgi:RNA polymerase sigma factor (sigma-70 family)